MARKLKIMKKYKQTLEDLKNDEKTEKREKWEMHTVWPGIWRDNWKTRKIRITIFRQWNMTRNIEKHEKW